MFSKFGFKKDKDSKKDKNHSEMVDRISKMNLTDIKGYLNNRIKDLEVTSDGLVEIMKKLTTINESTSKRYIEIDDDDMKKKKGFEVVIAVALHKKINVETVELIEKFISMNEDIIIKYDTDNKQIFGSKLKDALTKAVGIMDEKTNINLKMDLLKY